MPCAPALTLSNRPLKCCFARLKPRIVRLLAYEALSQCTASLPQWYLELRALFRGAVRGAEEYGIDLLQA